ncbi:MAG TPA: phospholipase [Parvibaculum sp.]|jgi:phospholipase/carboxylesterase
MNDDGEVLVDAIMALVPPLLDAMEGLGFIGRHLHPPHLHELIDSVGNADQGVRAGLVAFNAISWPDDLARFRRHIETAADAVCKTYDGLRAAKDDPNGIMAAYRALRFVPRAAEALYPVTRMLPPVSQFFLEPSVRGNEALADRLANADLGRPNIGVMHANNEKGTRGGCSIYVPEYYDPATPAPLIIAMHGGSGHGRDMLWSWIANARSHGAILISPTSLGDTWSLMEPDLDNQNLHRMLGHVFETWNIDHSHILLTGMSDGGTFSYVLGLNAGAPFTHLAPIAASFHPFLIEMADPARVKDLPIYITHGALDWMFPADMARVANRALTGAGAQVVYREIADLSHTYPRDENPRIMNWFLPRG